MVSNVSDTNAKPPPPVTEEPIVKSSPTYHTVKSGETLSKIAGKYGCTVNNLVDWNNLKSHNIMVGQRLKISSEGEEKSIASTSKPKTTASSSSTAKKTSSQKYIWHTIQPGDNLWDIAEKYDGATVAQIKKLNNITNAQRLKVGQKIKVMPAN
jgi:LysM repeat protein